MTIRYQHCLWSASRRLPRRAKPSSLYSVTMSTTVERNYTFITITAKFVVTVKRVHTKKVGIKFVLSPNYTYFCDVLSKRFQAITMTKLSTYAQSSTPNLHRGGYFAPINQLVTLYYPLKIFHIHHRHFIVAGRVHLSAPIVADIWAFTVCASRIEDI